MNKNKTFILKSTCRTKTFNEDQVNDKTNVSIGKIGWGLKSKLICNFEKKTLAT